MSTTRKLLISILVTLVTWGILSHPLPRYFSKGIPCHVLREGPPARQMVPGDHLQLMYHFWLLKDMIRGETPWWHNVYEFNTGDDSERLRQTAYFAPFSLIYGLGSWMSGSQATGWNLAFLFALFATYLASWRLAALLVKDEKTAALLALPVLMLPFRWSVLCGGSPSGFAMMYIPLAWWGLLAAVRDGRWAGGIATALALALCPWGDLQTFYFLVLSLPPWLLLILLMRNAESSLPLGRRALRLLPLLAGGFASIVYLRHIKSALRTATISEGYQLEEVALFSPKAKGLVGAGANTLDNSLLLGITALLFLLLGLVLYIRRARSNPETRSELLVYVLALLGLGFVALMALGPNGPFEGRAFDAIRLRIPEYRMVRQPLKIYTLLPTFLLILSCLAWRACRRNSGLPTRLLTALPLLYAVGMFVECKRLVAPELSLLDAEQGAYQALIDDVAAHPDEGPPRALALPLWPGDSAWSSICEYYSSLYRVRMVNGYSPVVPQRYVDEVFRPFMSLNQGQISDTQLDALRSRGIRHLLLFENAFPEKVSPFPVTFTLERLLAHPRIRLLTRDAAVWSFRILDSPEAQTDAVRMDDFRFPARRWEWESSRFDNAKPEGDLSANGPGLLRLTQSGARALLKPTFAGPVEGLRWSIRLRGAGTLKVQTRYGDSRENLAVRDTRDLSVSGDWQWYDIPASIDAYGAIALGIELVSGEVDADMALLMAGTWDRLDATTRHVTLPAIHFFHAGYGDPETGEVTLRRDYELKGPVFYGPAAPLSPGIYEVSIIYRASAKSDTLLGTLHLRQDEVFVPMAEMHIGKPCVFKMALPDNRPFQLEFHFSRKADVVLERVTFRRQPHQAEGIAGKEARATR